MFDTASQFTLFDASIWLNVITLISLSANTSHHAPQNPPKATLPPQTTQATNNTTVGHTTPMQKTSNHTSKPSKAAQNISTTAVPTHKSTTTTTPAAPDFGDVSQADDSPGTFE